MNKKELIVAAAAAAEMTQKDVEAALKGLIEATIATVAAKGKVQLIGKDIKIAAATVPVFKAGKAFKEAVNVKPKKKAAKKAKK